MSNIGNIIPGLSTKANLLAGGYWQSADTILGQYNSLTITVRCSTNTELTIYWGDNGDEYPVSEVQTFTAGVGSYVALVTVNKWVQLAFSNLGGDMSYCSLQTYGTVTNNSVSAILVPSIGNRFSSINIANLPYNTSGLEVSALQCLENNSYRHFTSGTLATYLSSLPDITVYSNNAVDTIISNVFSSVAVGLTNYAIDDFVLMMGKYPVRVPAGIPAAFKFTCSLVATAAKDSFCGALRSDAADNVALMIQDGMGIAVVNNVVGFLVIQDSVPTFIAQINWNVDKFNGTSGQQSSLLLDVSENNVYQIQLDRTGAIIFTIQDIDGKMKPAHIIEANQGGSRFLSPAFVSGQYVLAREVGTSAATTVDIFESSILMDLNSLGKTIPTVTSYLPGTGTITVGTERYSAIYNSNTLNTQTPENSLVQVTGVSITGVGATASISSVLIANVLINVTIPDPFGASTQWSVVTSTTGAAVTNVLVPARRPRAFYFRGDTAVHYDLKADNIFVRTGETAALAFQYLTGTVSPLTLHYTLEYSEYR
jgi:hypothetical protein